MLPRFQDDVTHSGTLTGFVELDGISVLHPARHGRGMPVRLSYEALLKQFSGNHSLIRYYSRYGCYHLKLRVEDDLIAGLPPTPPSIGTVLSQAAVDTILTLGDSPETAGLDRDLRDHAEFSRLCHEIEALKGREHSERAVSLVLPFSRLKDDLAAAANARGRADQLLTLVGSLKAGSLIEPSPEEQEAIRAYLDALQKDLQSEFDDKVAGINNRVSEVYAGRVQAVRETIEPRYRRMLDRMMRHLTGETTSVRLFVRPVLSLDQENMITVVLRPSTIAHVARYGAYHSPFDFEFALPYQSALLMQRDRPLWLRIVSAESMSAWHRQMLKMVYHQALSASAASLPHRLPVEERFHAIGAGMPHHELVP